MSGCRCEEYENLLSDIFARLGLILAVQINPFEDKNSSHSLLIEAIREMFEEIEKAIDG